MLAGFLAPSCRSSPLSDSATRVRARGRRQSGREREGDLFFGFCFVREIPPARARLRPGRGAHLASQKSPTGRTFAFFSRAPPGIPAFLRSLSCPSRRLASDSKSLASLVVFGLCRNAREDLDEKSLPLPTSSGGRRKVVSYAERGRRFAGSVVSFFPLSSPSSAAVPESTLAHARARGGRRSTGRLALDRFDLEHRLETRDWTGQTMMENFASSQKRYAPAPLFFPFRRLPVSSPSPLSPLLLERDPSALPSMTTPALHSLVDSSTPAAPSPLSSRLRVQERPFISRARTSRTSPSFRWIRGFASGMKPCLR